jgi:hypothetical protein
MRAGRKIIIFSSLFLLIMVGLLASAALYLYMHPEVIAAHAGKYLSDAAGIEIRADRLDWSIRPLRIDAWGVGISPASNPDAFNVQIPELVCRMHLDGGFGHRILIVDYVRAGGLSAKIREMDFKGSWKKSENGGAFRKVLRRMAALIFFKDVFIREISIDECDLNARFKGFDLVMARFSAHRGPEGRIKIEGEADVRMRNIDGALSAPDIRLTLQPGISFPSIRVSADLEVKDAELAIRGEELSGICGRFDIDVDIVEKSITASNAVVSAGSFLEFEGSLEGQLVPRPTVKVNAEKCMVHLSDLPSFISKELPQVKVNGPFNLTGRAEGMMVDEKWKVAGDAEAIIENAAFSWKTDNSDFAGVVSGTANFSIDPSGFPAISSVGLVLSKATFSNDAAVVDLADTEMRFSGKHPNYEVERFSARAPRVVLATPGKGLGFENIHVTGSGFGVDLDSLSVDFSKVSISLPPAGDFSARGRINPEMSNISVSGKGADLVPLAVKLGLVPVGWEISARNMIELEASLNSEGIIALDSGVRLEGLSFQDPSGRFIGEGLSARFDFDGRVDLDTTSISGKLSARAAEGELLLDLFYLDLGLNPFRSSGFVEFVINNRQVRATRYSTGFEKLFDIVLEGTANFGSVISTRLAVDFPGASLSPLYDLLVREPLGRRQPLLENLQPEGKISADMDLSYTSTAMSVTGKVELREGRFSITEKEIHGNDINIDLPVWIASGARENRIDTDSEPPSGRFSAAELRVPFLPVQGLDFKIAAAPNRIRIPVPPVIRMHGGRIEFGKALAADILREGFKVETSTRILSEDLSPILSGIWPREKNSMLEGLLDPVVLEKNQISTSGSLRGRIFGGKVSITGLQAQRIFSAAPLFKLSLDFSGIDLGKLTGDTPFGRIDGTMNGYIRNLEIAGSQPQHFDMLLETEQGSENQRISIKAVENISRIGAGESPFSGFGGVLTTFFKTLGYKKIGIRASLNNDYFTISGTIKEDGTEYIMKRGGISGVNIVNRNPDNRIRFKDMVNRIKRVVTEDR